MTVLLGLLGSKAGLRIIAVLGVVAALYSAYLYVDGRGYDRGRDELQAEIDEATKKLNDAVRKLEGESRRLSEELDEQRIMNEQLARELANEAESDPDAGNAGLGSDARLRLDRIR